jgi:hypothetical protein
VKRPLRTLVLPLLLAIPGAAFAGLNLEAPATYVPGEIITITVTGDSEGRIAAEFRVSITFDDALAVASVERGDLDNTGFDWWLFAGATGLCGPDVSGFPPNRCLAVDAFTSYVGSTRVDLLPSTLTTWQFDTTGATGDLRFVLEPEFAGFFDLPGTEAVVAQVPEPASAALVAAGLLALAGARRRKGTCWNPRECRRRVRLPDAIVALAVLLAAPVPSRAGLNLDAPASYTPGDILTITVTGDSEGAEDTLMSALMIVEEPLTLVSVTHGTLHSSDPIYPEWLHTGVSGTCGSAGLAPNECLAVDAFTYFTFPPPIDLLPSTLTTWQFDTTNATGNLLFLLEPRAPAGFFGLPGTQATVVMIPEPAPVALVAAGLVGVGAARGRKQRC